ncbi:hypothetical protein RW080711_156 [Synechococcus phage S-RIM8]|uniref:Uncharacterized protein n=2 Tax=Neptunevirus srim18 TaxID=2734121 RepID=A0A1D7SAU6_9CAUD|nr:hypothetical protein SXDG_00196 [Synechococcus phage S-RIM8 A.HR1]YP_009783065.1 hypothetical protein HOQ82_gp089 [Synechococcus phage S-RIM8]AFB15425.1 gp164 [Synechococcus phage S-RIM8 A.HR5]AFB17853.1 hypothetical protein SXEG_00059 [Synechococcus phage S-RIM8 A.HR3]AGH57893.1 hypothetical protein CPJG_00141 [Synechococcus phage KBS-M-1A]AFB17642.1 hypothetical protein SXDG_00196 [Synechococcus phage S-RIM8 A.HR1]AOO10743.1 hypothetical protein RW060613_155 [Synechococcus phage S-RIM8]
MEIRDIGTRGIQIRQLDIPPVIDTLNTTSTSLPPAPPVVVNIGVPVVDIPGCVEAHETNSKSKTVGGDDPKGLVTYCDSGVPSYNPINFEPNQIVPTRPSGVDTRQKEKPKPPGQVELPPAAPPATAKVDCPTPAQAAKEPVGTYIEGFRKKVTDYQLVGNQCIQITEPVPLPEQIVAGLPAAGTVVTTSSIAVVATASALMAKPLADVLLKVIKPTVKKVMKKIAAIRGKTVPVLSIAERRNEQRDRNRAIMALRQTLKPK